MNPPVLFFVLLSLLAVFAAWLGTWAAAAAGVAVAFAALAVYYCYCLLAMRRLAEGGLEPAADFVFGSGSVLAGALQHRAEIMPFLGSFQSPPKVVAEIGRAQGGTLSLLCRASSHDALLISLDLPGGRWAGGFPFLNMAFWRRPLLAAMRGPGQDLRLIDGDSHSPASVERFREALDGRKLDLLLIDGDHTYEGVKADYELYSGFVRPGGTIAFHDIQPGYEECGVGVSRFWREYPLPGARREYVADPCQLSFGIGVLRLPG